MFDEAPCMFMFNISIRVERRCHLDRLAMSRGREGERERVARVGDESGVEPARSV